MKVDMLFDAIGGWMTLISFPPKTGFRAIWEKTIGKALPEKTGGRTLSEKTGGRTLPEKADGRTLSEMTELIAAEFIAESASPPRRCFCF